MIGYAVALVMLGLAMTAALRDRGRLGGQRLGALLGAMPFFFGVALIKFGITDDLGDPLIPWGIAACYLTFLVLSAGHPALLTLDLKDAEDRQLVSDAEAQRLPWQRRAFMALIVVGALGLAMQ